MGIFDRAQPQPKPGEMLSIQPEKKEQPLPPKYQEPEQPKLTLEHIMAGLQEIYETMTVISQNQVQLNTLMLKLMEVSEVQQPEEVEEPEPIPHVKRK